MNLAGKRIVLGISGGIAAYRACDFIRELYRRGAEAVYAVMTPSAKEFITPLTLHSLTRHPVYEDAMGLDENGVPVHVALAQKGDALIILPATANLIARLAHGLADDLVTTTAITFGAKPVIIAPAMNTRMWDHPLTRQNVNSLEQLPNVTVVPPVPGDLACGETGSGHLADQEVILREVYRALHGQGDLFRGVKALVTAGGTREPVDPARVITNKSSGKMGLALADELDAMGAEVMLVTAQEAPPQRPYPIVQVETGEAMAEAVDRYFPETDLLLMSAAVTDFKVANVSEQKIKKGGENTVTLELTANRDILATVSRRRRPDQILVGFAAESEHVIDYAKEKVLRKGVDLVVANDISKPGIAFQSDDNEVTLVFKDGETVELPRRPKTEVARSILTHLNQRLMIPLRNRALTAAESSDYLLPVEAEAVSPELETAVCHAKTQPTKVQSTKVKKPTSAKRKK